LDVDSVVAEGSASFRPGGRERDFQFFFAACDLHAATTTTSRSLDDDRVADLGCNALGFLFLGDSTVGARNDGNAKALCGALGFDLVTHHADMVALGTDEGDVVRGQNVGELGVFRQEAVARVDRVSAGDFTGSHDLV